MECVISQVMEEPQEGAYKSLISTILRPPEDILIPCVTPLACLAPSQPPTPTLNQGIPPIPHVKNTQINSLASENNTSTSEKEMKKTEQPSAERKEDSSREESNCDEGKISPQFQSDEDSSRRSSATVNNLPSDNVSWIFSSAYHVFLKFLTKQYG